MASSARSCWLVILRRCTHTMKYTIKRQNIMVSGKVCFSGPFTIFTFPALRVSSIHCDCLPHPECFHLRLICFPSLCIKVCGCSISASSSCCPVCLCPCVFFVLCCFACLLDICLCSASFVYLCCIWPSPIFISRRPLCIFDLNNYCWTNSALPAVSAFGSKTHFQCSNQNRSINHVFHYLFFN